MQHIFKPLYTQIAILISTLALTLMILLFALSLIYLYHPQYASFMILNPVYASKSLYKSN